MPTCPGCRTWFPIGGYSSHLQQTKNPRCIAAREAEEAFGSISDSDVESNRDDEDPGPFRGDALGAYEDADFGEAGGQVDAEAENMGGDSDREETLDSEDEEEEWGVGLGDEEDAENARLEEGWEPPLLNGDVRMEVDEEAEVEDGGGDGGDGQEGAADGFGDGHVPLMDKGAKPFVTKYPDHRAGAPSEEDRRSGWQYYQSQLTDGGPWASKLDWEFARWAQLRGPGATALTELLKIEGVSALVS